MNCGWLGEWVLDNKGNGYMVDFHALSLLHFGHTNTNKGASGASKLPGIRVTHGNTSTPDIPSCFPHMPAAYRIDSRHTLAALVTLFRQSKGVRFVFLCLVNLN